MSSNVQRIFSEYFPRKITILEQVAAATRNVVPVMKDHNLSNTAKELERLLFELDALEQEALDAVQANPEAFCDMIAKMGKPPA